MEAADPEQRRANKMSCHIKPIKKNPTLTKVSDSVYSTSGSQNSQSRRSGSGSTKSTNSSAASGSSGYGGRPCTTCSGNVEPAPQTTDLVAESPCEVKTEARDDTATVDGAGEEATAERDAREDRSGPDSPGALRTAFSQTLSCLCGHGVLRPKEEPTSASTQPTCPAGDATVSDQVEEFTVVVSMQDGAVVYASPGITRALAFPRDMWVGRSFVDYVHPDDRLALIAHITSGVALPPNKRAATGGDTTVCASPPQSLHCRLRRYPALRDGFGVAGRGVRYRPFSLALSFCEVSPSRGQAALSSVLLTVTATAVASAYSEPRQRLDAALFTTRHLADGRLTHVDPAVVRLLGYLPHELAARPVFELYHPGALAALRPVYQQLVSCQHASPLRGKPYKMRAHNGCYVSVDTEWSSFVNPWSRQLEFVIGQHRVLEGPANPDVFAEPCEEEQFSEELLAESKKIQDEICRLLKEDVQRRVPTVDRGEVSRRCKDLASLMESLAGHNRPDAPNISERGSVALGEVSPHRDYYDSKSSSETPPSYNQLNYNENIQRFFESKPKTIPSDDSGERLMALDAANRSTDDDKSVSVAPGTDSSNRLSEDSGSGVSSRGSYKPTHLTQELLSRHNEDMAKEMAQKHREQRNKGCEAKTKKQHHHQQQAEAHGTKRSGSHSWDGEPLKASKTSHAVDAVGGGPGPPPTDAPGEAQRPAVSLWPPFSVAVTPSHGTCCSGGWCGAARPLLPVYYLPAPEQPTAEPRRQPHVPPAAAVPLVLYQPAPPLLYPLAPPPPPPAPPPQQQQQQPAPHHLLALHPSLVAHTHYQPPAPSYRAPRGEPRPASRATSVKAEPGSSATSVAIQDPTSDGSKPGRWTSGEEETEGEDKGQGSSSSYGSFLRTNTDDSSKDMPWERSETAATPRPPLKDMLWERTDASTVTTQNRPVRKDPPWLQQVDVTPDLLLRYQLAERAVDSVLERDLERLRGVSQPSMVNEQLGQLYADMARLATDGELSLQLEEGELTSSSSNGNSSGGNDGATVNKVRRKKRGPCEYGKLVMIFEENAPLPSPTPCSQPA